MGGGFHAPSLVVGFTSGNGRLLDSLKPARKSCSHIGNSDEILRYLHGLYAASNKAADALLKQSDMTLEWELALTLS